MASWPDVDNLKRRLNYESIDAYDVDFARLIAAGIAWVKTKVGDWNEDTDVPTDAHAQSALERAVEVTANGPTAPAVKSEALLYGSRRRFGIG